jgi:hypothetical protein
VKHFYITRSKLPSQMLSGLKRATIPPHSGGPSSKFCVVAPETLGPPGPAHKTSGKASKSLPRPSLMEAERLLTVLCVVSGGKWFVGGSAGETEDAILSGVSRNPRIRSFSFDGAFVSSAVEPSNLRRPPLAATLAAKPSD